MCGQCAVNLITHFLLRHCLVCYPRADRHNLYSDNPNLPIRGFLINVGVYVGQEVYVWVEPHADAVDEQNRQPCLGRMWTVPVGEALRRGGTGREQSEKTWGKGGEKLPKRRAVKVERVVS